MGCDDYGDTTAGTGAAGYQTSMQRTKREPEDSMSFNSSHPDRSDEDADHWMAEMLGGTSRTAKRKDEKLPGVQPHKAIPNMDGYCMVGIGGGELCGAYTNNPIHVGVQQSSVVANITHAAKFGCGVTHPGYEKDCSQCNSFIVEPHEAQSPPGVLGGSCLKCGKVSAHPIHNVPKPTSVDKSSAHEIASRPAVYVEVTGEDKANYEFLNLATQQSIEIVREVLPDILNRFLAKNKDYGDGFINLGPKAEFVRMANKFGKLKQALWDDQPLEFEQVDEIIDDLVGHLLLARLGLRK